MYGTRGGKRRERKGKKVPWPPTTSCCFFLSLFFQDLLSEFKQFLEFILECTTDRHTDSRWTKQEWKKMKMEFEAARGRDRVFGSALFGQCWMRQREPRLSSHTHSDHVWRVCSDGDDERSPPSSPLLLRLIRNTWSAFWRNRSGFKKQRRKVWKFVCMHASWRVINNKLIPKPSLAYIPSIAAIYLSNWL